MAFLYLVRHGETDANKNLVFQGQTGVGLNDRGRAQMERAGRRIARVGITTIVSSDLDRAVESANIVAKACKLTVTTTPELREIDVGTWSGKSNAQVEAEHPDEWAAWLAGLDVRRGGGETYSELGERIDRAIARIVDEHRDERILVLSHGAAIRSWLGKVLGLSTQAMRSLAGTANASITTADRDAHGRTKLHSWNDVAHLEGLGTDEELD